MEYPQNLSESDRRWFDLIQQCRTSGKSDFQWLQENNIKSATFYYHVKRLRKLACDIPENQRASKSEVQEVVPVFLNESETQTYSSDFTENNTVAVRLTIRGIGIEITNSATPFVIKHTLMALQHLC